MGMKYHTRPLANEKLSRRIMRLVINAAKLKHEIIKGVKHVANSIKKGRKGFCILAADITPLDIIAHIPVVCEDHLVPYIYIPSKDELGISAGSKRPISALLVISKSYEEKSKRKIGFTKELIKVTNRVKAVQLI